MLEGDGVCTWPNGRKMEIEFTNHYPTIGISFPLIMSFYIFIKISY